ncbi:MAG: methyltransferase domain-containing protein [Gemmatimonadaceae bacterium]|jgi:SAM-dependent methyltransferase|nr:methyltransferase domain-containing protein [Gemmatimonadaceae bacterium]
MTTPEFTHDEHEHARVLAANVTYHAALADAYNATQPHFRPENVTRVDAIVAELAARTGGRTLLDLGCGTGFMIAIALPHFQRVVGVDLTRAMLEKVDRSSGRVELHESDTATVPVPDSSVDVCTAYSFLHHLHDLRPTLREAARCLRPGGVFYADADPNRAFWQLMHEVRERADLRGVVAREARSVVDVEDDVSRDTGLSSETVALAEFQKVALGGLDPDAVAAMLREVGFAEVEIRYEWFLGEGKVIHEQSPADARLIDRYLREMLPATRALYKYVAFRAIR